MPPDKMAFLEGLMFRPGLSGMPETRQNVPSYSGSPETLQEWKFKLMIKQNAILATKDEIQRKERMADLISRVTDGLSGDALKVAMDLGDELEKDEGLQTLIDRIDTYVTAFKEDEAK